MYEGNTWWHLPGLSPSLVCTHSLERFQRSCSRHISFTWQGCSWTDALIRTQSDGGYMAPQGGMLYKYHPPLGR